MPLTIRKMNNKDLNAWAHMRVKLWGNHTFEEHLTDISSLLENNRYTGYIAHTDDSEPVAFAEIALRNYANGCTKQPVPFLEGIWVKSTHQRKGIGNSLLAYISEDLNQQGYSEICSDAEISNSASHHAHTKWGFEETERVIYFRKALA